MTPMTAEPIYKPTVYRGKVQWFHRAKGYGYIAVGAVCDCPCHRGFNRESFASCAVCKDRHAEDVFVHFSHIDMPGYRYLRTDDDVEFELIESERKDKKFQAHNVRVIG